MVVENAEVRPRDGGWTVVFDNGDTVRFWDDRNAAIRAACKMARMVALYSPANEFKLYMPGREPDAG